MDGDTNIVLPKSFIESEFKSSSNKNKKEKSKQINLCKTEVKKTSRKVESSSSYVLEKGSIKSDNDKTEQFTESVNMKVISKIYVFYQL